MTLKKKHTAHSTKLEMAGLHVNRAREIKKINNNNSNNNNHNKKPTYISRHDHIRIRTRTLVQSFFFFVFLDRVCKYLCMENF